MIYLDHNATTPVTPEVLEAMLPYLSEEWGNPSSSYRFGSKLKGVVEAAREQVAELIGANPREILFTSCATESNNAAIHAALKANPGKRLIVTSAVEHSSVLNYCMALEGNHGLHGSHGLAAKMRDETQEASALLKARSSGRESAPSSSAVFQSRLTSAATAQDGGYRVTYLPVDRDGLLKLADLENAVTDDTAVVSLMWANNETGVLFPVKGIADFCRSRGVLFHCDAVQAAGKVETGSILRRCVHQRKTRLGGG